MRAAPPPPPPYARRIPPGRGYPPSPRGVTARPPTQQAPPPPAAQYPLSYEDQVQRHNRRRQELAQIYTASQQALQTYATIRSQHPKL
jgi:hypothetical protein